MRERLATLACSVLVVVVPVCDGTCSRGISGRGWCCGCPFALVEDIALSCRWISGRRALFEARLVDGCVSGVLPTLPFPCALPSATATAPGAGSWGCCARGVFDLTGFFVPSTLSACVAAACAGECVESENRTAPAAGVCWAGLPPPRRVAIMNDECMNSKVEINTRSNYWLWSLRSTRDILQ